MNKIILFGLTLCLVTSSYAKELQVSELNPTSGKIPSFLDHSFSFLTTSAEDGKAGAYDMLEEEEYDEPLSSGEGEENETSEQEKMEETNEIGSSVLRSEHAIDYDDRTRTDRERKALNTSSHASDDE